MALATSPAAAISWSSSWVRGTLMVALLLSLAAPALAAEQVYIWRDANGAIKFSPVRDSPRPIASLVPDASAAPECRAQPPIVTSEAMRRAAY
jgi:hypothetical protein